MHSRDLLNARPCSFRCDFGKNLASPSNQFAGSADRRFEFDKRSQLFIRPPNEALAVAAMRVCNPDRSPATVDG
jgi:hypothetical protein